MRIRVIAVGTRMPAWVDAAVVDFSRRIRPPWRVELLEIPVARRGARDGDAARASALEGERVLAALRGAHAVALDERGRERSTRELAQWLERRAATGEELALLLGGPDGHASAVRAAAAETLSLSRLTLPHALARVVLFEQIYRAQSLLLNHPYHRD
jgi:23S rRNA (pseudouridine1915-N3)-methyltransferase